MANMIECRLCRSKIARNARVCHFCGKKVSRLGVRVLIVLSVAVCVVYWLVS